MSRSRRKRPFSGITLAKSEKQEKRLANRRIRRVNKSLLAYTNDETQLRRKREVSNVWCMSKDGKQRFDPETYPELMRK
jgi:hypothetical protein